MTNMRNITAMVLAGGFGTRLRDITQDRCPKPMVPIPTGKEHLPFLEFVLGNLHSQGVRDVVLCVGHLGCQITNHFEDGTRFGLRICYDDAGTVDTGKRVLSAMRLVPGSDFLVTCGDVYVPFELGEFWDNFARNPQWKCQVAAVEPPEDKEPNVVLDSNGNILVHGSYEDQTGRVGFEVGTFAARKSALSGFSTARDFSLTEDLFPELIARQQLGGVLVDSLFFDIGTPTQYYKFCDFAVANDATPLSRASVGGMK